MKARTTAGILTCMVLLAAVTASMQADTINTDFTEASFGDIGLVKDIPNPGIATIDLDTLEDRLQIQGTAGMNMWTARADAPIAYILKPTGSLWFAETEVELDDPSLDRQIRGLPSIRMRTGQSRTLRSRSMFGSADRILSVCRGWATIIHTSVFLRAAQPMSSCAWRSRRILMAPGMPVTRSSTISSTVAECRR